MFNATLIVIEAFIRELRTMYERTYETMEPGYPGVSGRRFCAAGTLASAA